MKLFKSAMFINNNAISASRKRITGTTAYHGHEFFEIEFVVEGSGTYFVDGIPYPIQKNTAFIMSPQNIHAIENADATIVNVMFLREYGDALFDYFSFLDLPPALFLEEDAGVFLKTIFLEIAQSSESRPDYATALLQCALYKLNDTAPGQQQPQTSYIRRGISYVQTHFYSQITLASTAKHLGLSPAYFSDLFHQSTGVSFKAYLDEIRFSYAKKMLGYTDLSVKEVCSKAGFADYSNFSRRFKKRYAQTPSDYRAALHKE